MTTSKAKGTTRKHQGENASSSDSLRKLLPVKKMTISLLNSIVLVFEPTFDLTNQVGTKVEVNGMKLELYHLQDKLDPVADFLAGMDALANDAMQITNLLIDGNCIVEVNLQPRPKTFQFVVQPKLLDDTTLLVSMSGNLVHVFLPSQSVWGESGLFFLNGCCKILELLKKEAQYPST